MWFESRATEDLRRALMENQSKFVLAIRKLAELVAAHDTLIRDTLAESHDHIISVGACCVPWAPIICVTDRVADSKSPLHREMVFRFGTNYVSVKYAENGEVLDVVARDREGHVADFVRKLASDPEKVLMKVIQGYYTIADVAQSRLPPHSSIKEGLAQFMRSLENLCHELFGGSVAPDENMRSTLMRLYEYKDKLGSAAGAVLRQTVESAQDVRRTGDKVVRLHLKVDRVKAGNAHASVSVFSTFSTAKDRSGEISVSYGVYGDDASVPTMSITASASFGAGVAEEEPTVHILLLKCEPINGELLAVLDAVRCFTEKLPEVPSRLYQVLEDYGLIALNRGSAGASGYCEAVDFLEKRREDVKARWKEVNLRELFKGVWPRLELIFEQAGFSFKVRLSDRESSASKRLLNLNVGSELYTKTPRCPKNIVISVLLTAWSKDSKGRPSYVRVEVLRPSSAPPEHHSALALGAEKVDATASLIANPTKLAEFLSKVKNSTASLMRCT